MEVINAFGGLILLILVIIGISSTVNSLRTRKTSPMERAIRDLDLRHRIRCGERTLDVALLIREADWKPLRAPWCRQEQAFIIGADLNGNFFLRSGDGSVRYRDHQAQSDSAMAASIPDFLRLISSE